MRYYLGVDQGGTKTIAALCDETGRILGCGAEGGLVTHYFEDHDEVYVTNIRKASLAALEHTEVSLSDVYAVCGCLNGADWNYEYPILAKSLMKATGCNRATVLNDCLGGLRGGSDADECAVVCAGSGMNMAVRRKNMDLVIYGYYVSEQDQGAHALGKAAFLRMNDAHTGLCPPTLLTSLILAHAGYDSMEHLMIACTLGQYVLVYKDLAPLLLTAYALGDGGAADIIDSFVRRVAQYIIGGAERLGILESAMPVVYSGSVFKDDGTLITQALTRQIRGKMPNAYGVDALFEPVCGALLTLLDRQGGGRVERDVMEAFSASAPEMGLIRNTSPHETTMDTER